MTLEEKINNHILIYSCKLGWIDLGHANLKFKYGNIMDFGKASHPYIGAHRLWDQILNEKGVKSRDAKGFKVTTRQQHTSHDFGALTGITKEYFVKYKLSRSEKEGIALSIFKEACVLFEEFQGNALNFLSSRSRGSSFSAEDLVSDLIGLYVAVKQVDDFQKLFGKIVEAKEALQITKKWNPEVHKNRYFLPHTFPWKACNSYSEPKYVQLPEDLQTILPAAKGQNFRDWMPSDNQPNFQSYHKIFK